MITDRAARSEPEWTHLRNVEALKAEIGRIIYDLFDLTNEKRDVIEEYLWTF